MVGRRCSRGRLGEEVSAGGVGVHTGGRPPQLRLLSPGSSSPAGSRPPSPGAARRGVVPFPFSPGASRGDEEEKTPMGLVASRPRFACLAPF
jgi:hypothetical protein